MKFLVQAAESAVLVNPGDQAARDERARQTVRVEALRVLLEEETKVKTSRVVPSLGDDPLVSFLGVVSRFSVEPSTVVSNTENKTV